jgi:hypothetical protein
MDRGARQGMIVSVKLFFTRRAKVRAQGCATNVLLSPGRREFVDAMELVYPAMHELSIISRLLFCRI